MGVNINLYKKVGGTVMYNTSTQQNAADIFHNYLDEAHLVVDGFKTTMHIDSMNKMRHFWGNLHMASGARYIYADSDCDLTSQQWLMMKGKHVIDELIVDAEKGKMKDTLKKLRELRKILEDKNLIN